MATIECAFCEWEFTPAAPGITACPLCFREGAVHEALYPDLLREVRAVLPVGATAQFTFVGEADYVLEVRGPGLYPIIVATVAVPAEDGTWTTRPALPDVGQPWALALFRNIRQWPQYPEITKLPATDAEFVAFVREHRDALDLFPQHTAHLCKLCGLPRPCEGEGHPVEQEA